MVTQLQQKRPHTIKIDFEDQPVTSFGGLVLAERLAQRLRLWSTLAGMLPPRRGYDWPTAIKSLMLGLLSGAQGTAATEPLRDDQSLLSLLSLPGAPEEATLWRMLEGLGKLTRAGVLGHVHTIAARRVLEKITRPQLLLEGQFVPLFADGTLLEGSARREGTKHLSDKGRGLMWSTLFVGPVLAAQSLAGAGEGEQSCVRAMLGTVRRDVLDRLGLARQALVLADSLHGDGPTLTLLEDQGLHYVIGANKLDATEKTLRELPEVAWQGCDRASVARHGWAAAEVCQCWLQCEEWPVKRVLIGRRFKRQGDLFWNYAGVLTDLTPCQVAPIMARHGASFLETIWRLYDAKGALETLFSDGLSDLGLHHPPCQELVRNEGFYAAAALAWLLGTAVDQIGGQGPERGSRRRLDGGVRARPRPRRMRLWRVRRWLWAVPARVARHGHELALTILGLSAARRTLFERYWAAIARC